MTYTQEQYTELENRCNGWRQLCYKHEQTICDLKYEVVMLNEEIIGLRAVLSEVLHAWDNYERQGAISELEGQPLIYAVVLEELAELAKGVLK